MVPDHCFKKRGGLELLLSCNYNIDFLDDLPKFYKDALKFVSELTSLYSNNSWRDQLLYNNKDILIGGKPFFNREWYSKGILEIRNLLSQDGSFLSFSNFRNKYSLKKKFLQFYQVISAIPNHLLLKARTQDSPTASNYNELTSFQLGNEIEINLLNAKAKDFYWLLVKKIHTCKQTGSKRWEPVVKLNDEQWKNIYNSVRKICKENRLKEYHFKFIHRIIITKKELHRFGVKSDDNCLYCGEQDSIDHTFIECPFTKRFVKTCIGWFNDTNGSQFNLTTDELLFGIPNPSSVLLKKLNYTLLFMRRSINIRKLNEEALILTDFISKIKSRYRLENFIVNAS